MVSQKLNTQGDSKEEGEEVDRNIRCQEVTAEVYTMSKPTFLPNPFHCAFSDQTSAAEARPCCSMQEDTSKVTATGTAWLPCRQSTQRAWT